jgi:homospermidine synthase
MKIIFIGMGAVGRSIMELLPICELLQPDTYSKIAIIEPRRIPRLRIFQGYAITHYRQAITAKNVDTVMSRVLEPEDIVIDVSVNVDALAIMRNCYNRGCMYINTSMENWMFRDPEHIDPDPTALYERSLYSRIMSARELFASSAGISKPPSMLADMGMNPGLISCFTMQCIRDMAKYYRNTAALSAAQSGSFAQAAQLLGIRVIHITEHDTQITHAKKPIGTFCNTWSAEGLLAESLDPVQIGIGTHDQSEFPKNSVTFGNVCVMPVRGMDMTLWSMTPTRTGSVFQKFQGFSIPHGEANTISDYLTVHDDGKAVYRPSVFFVYQPCAIGRESLQEMRKAGYVSQQHYHTLHLSEIRSGYDAIGALCITESGQAWWSGTVLDVQDMKRMGVSYAGPTTIQVAISIAASLRYMCEHRHLGFITPECLPYERILQDSVPYLGKVYSGPVRMPKMRKPIQFDSFLVKKN